MPVLVAEGSGYVIMRGAAAESSAAESSAVESGTAESGAAESGDGREWNCGEWYYGGEWYCGTTQGMMGRYDMKGTIGNKKGRW